MSRTLGSDSLRGQVVTMDWSQKTRSTSFGYLIMVAWFAVDIRFPGRRLLMPTHPRSLYKPYWWWRSEGTTGFRETV
ncbi:hypothetical protein M407DRAFT_247253, partial [Tulasnella calospora MUT 4182]